MSKKHRKINAILGAENVEAKEQKRLINRPYDIMGAKLTDGFCTYDVKVLDGEMAGEKSNVTGPLIVDQDLRDALTRLCVHMAIIDMAFVHSNIDVQSLEDVRDHHLVSDYDVDGIKIKGADENVKVSLIGSKYLSTCTGRMSCVTPYILLDAGTEYKWYNELLEDVKRLCQEVALYKEGKGRQPETKKKKTKVKQFKITDAMVDAHAGESVQEQEFGENVTL
jgi:hypothetical protein